MDDEGDEDTGGEWEMRFVVLDVVMIVFDVVLSPTSCQMVIEDPLADERGLDVGEGEEVTIPGLNHLNTTH